MQQYRKKGMPGAAPVQAVQIAQDTIAEASMLTHGHVVVEIHPETDERTVGINVATVHGVKRASTGDFVIRDAAGGLHVMGQVEFLFTFDRVEEELPRHKHINVRETRLKQREPRDG